MDALQKQVQIELRTTIDDNGQMEYNTLSRPGTFFRKDKLDVITYEEETEEDVTTKNLITIQDGKVSIKRTGGLAMNQQFRSRQTTENVLKHPYGTIHMETYTNNITYQPFDDREMGKLTISYTVKLNGQEERKHELALTFKEEGLV
ncbi:DUF1934 domain-containing protein [Virgibacillus sp. NKC19-16]|uniref:DUF1934 domain-containing protein n=1 Tax=Virgibacillus salidurans TaxID=2831673 RepID=UPI001F217A18|nr:DUF1934 domain-containing protein [Virgibacillus sp. NKC19-16]UJL48339.1 DUF1934 domain-containing protein [Virgibacillus sp. NKC19-16]